MSFEHSCFISYRRGQWELAERIVRDVHRALSNELELLTGCDVYLDTERMRPGQFFDQKVAWALHSSACMVMLYTPTYFDLEEEDSYCAREFRAMEFLEQERLARIGGTGDGLIVPIIFRGLRFLPKEVKNRRQYHSFEKFLLNSPELARHHDYAGEIREVAEYIADRFHALRPYAKEFDAGRDAYRLPTYSDIRPWLEQMCGSQPPPRLPLTGEAA